MNHLIWRVPVYILAAIGVPIGLVAIVGTEALLGRPGIAVGLFVAYEVLLYLALFASAGQGRNKPRVQRIASSIIELGSSIGHSILSLFSVRRRRYLRYVREHCRELDLGVFSKQGEHALALQDVFVEPSLAFHPSSRRSADSGPQMPRDLRTGRHTIWTYLRSSTMGERSLVVTGPPGSGKTTLLQHVSLVLAAGPVERFKLRAPSKLPLRLCLCDHAAAIAGAAWPGDYDLVRAVEADLRKGDGPDLTEDWFDRLLGRGRFLVLLDSLDGVADPAVREQVVAWVQDQMRAYPRVRFVIASRPLGYRANPLDGVTRLEIRPFDRDQVERFARKRHLAHETGGSRQRDSRIATRVETGVRDLLKRVWSTFALSELAANPLLLVLLTTLHRHRHTLPERRFQVYAQVCEALFGDRRAEQGGQEDAFATEMGVLGRLAYEMMSRQVLQISSAEAVAIAQKQLALVSPGISATEFIRDVANESSLLVQRQQGVYAFAHRTFQEYLAAVHVKGEKLESELLGRVGDVWWHETIRFCVAQSDATAVLSHCLVHDPPAIPVLVLAIECMAQARYVSPDVRFRFDEMMERGAEDEDPERRRLIAEALLAYRLRSLVPLDDDRSADTVRIAHAEYQLFLDEKRAQDEFYHPDHWTGHTTFLQGTAQEPALGVRYTDAIVFCEWLTERAGGVWRYRLPAVTELDAEMAPEGSGYWALDGGQGRCVGIEAPDWNAAGKVIDQWIDDAVAVDLARACTRAVDLASVIGRASALDLDLASDLARARDRAIDLAGACNRGNTSAIDLATIGIRDVASDLAGARTIARARPLPRNLGGIIARASARACAIARDVSCARDRAHAGSGGDSDLVAAIDDAGDNDFSAAVGLVGGDDLASAIDLARGGDLSRTLNFAGALNLASARAVDRELAQRVAANLARTIDHGALGSSAYQTARNVIGLRAPLVGLGLESVDSLLQYVRRYTVLSLWLAETSFVRAPSWWARQVRSGSELDRWEKLEELQSRLTDLYIDLCIWDARVKGAFPPFEGIRIVRERIGPEEDSASRPS